MVGGLGYLMGEGRLVERWGLVIITENRVTRITRVKVDRFFFELSHNLSVSYCLCRVLGGMILVLYKLFSCLRGVMISVLNYGLKTLHTSGSFILRCFEILSH